MTDKVLVDWHDESEAPQERGWYAIKRADDSLCIRGWSDGMWWIPLKDGWMSGLPAGFQWLGPLEPIEWNTPQAKADKALEEAMPVVAWLWKEQHPSFVSDWHAITFEPCDGFGVKVAEKQALVRLSDALAAGAPDWRR